MTDFAVIDRAQLAESQESPEATVNEAIDDVVRMLAKKTSIAVTTNTVDASSASDDNTSNYRIYLRNFYFKFTGGPAGSPSDVEYTVPTYASTSNGDRPFIVENAMTSNALRVRCSGQSGVWVLPGRKALVLNNGTDVELLQDLSSFLSTFVAGNPSDGSTMLRFKAPFDFTLKAGLQGVQVGFSVAPASSAVIWLDKNGTSPGIGSITVGTNGQLTVSFAADVSFSRGVDTLIITAPNPADANLRDVNVTLPISRS